MHYLSSSPTSIIMSYSNLNVIYTNIIMLVHPVFLDMDETSLSEKHLPHLPSSANTRGPFLIIRSLYAIHKAE